MLENNYLGRPTSNKNVSFYAVTQTKTKQINMIFFSNILEDIRI